MSSLKQPSPGELGRVLSRFSYAGTGFPLRAGAVTVHRSRGASRMARERRPASGTLRGHSDSFSDLICIVNVNSADEWGKKRRLLIGHCLSGKVTRLK